MDVIHNFTIIIIIITIIITVLLSKHITICAQLLCFMIQQKGHIQNSNNSKTGQSGHNVWCNKLPLYSCKALLSF